MSCGGLFLTKKKSNIGETWIHQDMWHNGTQDFSYSLSKYDLYTNVVNFSSRHFNVANTSFGPAFMVSKNLLPVTWNSCSEKQPMNIVMLWASCSSPGLMDAKSFQSCHKAVATKLLVLGQWTDRYFEQCPLTFIRHSLSFDSQ